MTVDGGIWRPTSNALGPFGKLVRIENAIDRGTFDVAYVLTRPKAGSLPASGWLELKFEDNYPVRPTTTLRAKELTLDQVRFAEDWAEARGRAWLLLRAAPWWLLFDPKGTRGLFEKAIRAADGPAAATVAAMSSTFPTGPILKALTA